MIIFSAIESILSIIIMIGLGYFLTYKKWFDEKTKKIFSKLVTRIALPCYMVSNLMTNFSKEKLLKMDKGLIVPFLSMVITYGIACVVCKIIKVEKGRQGSFISMFFVSNTIFIGLPVNVALFGNKSIPIVLLYYMVNTVFFWTIGVYGISKDGNNHKVTFNFAENVKKIFSPPLMGFMVGLFFVLLNLKLPSFVMDTLKYMGNLTTPMSMLFIGMAIFAVDRKDIKISKDMIAIMLGRFIVSPLSVIVLAQVFPMPVLMKKVFVMQAAMPVMTQTSITAKAYGADEKYAAVMTTVSTVLAAAVIPIYMALF